MKPSPYEWLVWAAQILDDPEEYQLVKKTQKLNAMHKFGYSIRSSSEMAETLDFVETWFDEWFSEWVDETKGIRQKALEIIHFDIRKKDRESFEH